MKTTLGLIATLLAIGSYIPYFWQTLTGKLKPHTFSWVIWSTLAYLVFVAQLQDGGGAGAWALGMSALLSTFVLLLAFKKGEKHITPSDWACLFGAGIALGLWLFVEDAAYSVVLATIITSIGFIPTVRKSYGKPHEEDYILFLVSVIKYVLVLFALENITLVTAVYPVSAIVLSGSLTLMLLVRRKQLGPMRPI